jgi:hypothetical protein
MMLSPLDDGRLLVVLQIDHSRVAGLTVAHWGNDEFAEPTPFASTVVAAGGHDSAWWDWEIKPFLKTTGEVIDYYRSNEVLGEVWHEFTTKWIERLTKVDIYAGFLVSMHHQGLLTGGFGTLPHMPDRSTEPFVAEFIASETARREALLAKMRTDVSLVPFVTDLLVMHNYKLVQMGDQFGQLLCNRHPFDSDRRKTGPSLTLSAVPTRPGSPDVQLSIEPVDSTTATVTPWPFDSERVEFQIPARVLSRSRYEDHDAFLHDYLKADQIAVSRILTPAA